VGDVDDLGVRQLMLQQLDASLDEPLLLAGGVILGVFAQVAVGSRLGDGLDDTRPVFGLQASQLGTKLLGSLLSQRLTLHA
jgi:hypothetical protein